MRELSHCWLECSNPIGYWRESSQRLAEMNLPEPWLGTVEASLRLTDELEAEVAGSERDLRALGAQHVYIPKLMTVPGIGWILAYTIASEIGDISRFASPKKLCGTPGCAHVSTSPAPRTTAELCERMARRTYAGRSSRRRLTPSSIRRFTITSKPPRSGSASSVAPRLLVSTSRAVLLKRSGTCSLAIKRSLRQAPQWVWSHDDPQLNWATGCSHVTWSSPRRR